MSSREFRLHDGKKGSAMAVRVTPRASENQVVGVLSDGTVKVHLTCSPADDEINTAVLAFLSEVLGVAKNRMEIVAGVSGRDKLVSILDLDSEATHQKIIAQLADN